MTSRITDTMALAAIVAGATGLGATAAHAIEGAYGRVDGGYSWEGQLNENSGATNLNLNEDWVESLGMGYAFGSGLRIEGEFAHRYHEVEPELGFVTEGDTHAWSAMGNVYYDFNKQGAVQPYVGVGVGVARVNFSATDPGTLTSYRDSDTAVAYQGLIGVGFRATENLSFDVGYRYFNAQSAKFSGVEGGFPATFGADYSDQAATVGLRWQFGEAPQAAPPPPPPAPPPTAYVPPPPAPPPMACPAMEFVVYFEWDRSNVNDAAFDAIDAAVNRARECNLAGVSVVGHTDTSGSPDYNRGLSERRASSVRDALVARGLNAYAIRTEGRGEADLQRPTRDGVREPLNRRSTVTLNFQ
ncbi:MAG: OmpA family protein [Hyphomonadaceae bacterium]|nr:OmpA family protein [Hyphomonadaceae bacterium]